jgi:hypothetical protein
MKHIHKIILIPQLPALLQPARLWIAILLLLLPVSLLSCITLLVAWPRWRLIRRVLLLLLLVAAATCSNSRGTPCTEDTLGCVKLVLQAVCACAYQGDLMCMHASS